MTYLPPHDHRAPLNAGLVFCGTACDASLRIHTRRNIRRRLNYLLWCSDLEATRFTLAMAALMWALLLFWPGETFSRPTYSLMGQMAPEWAWASLFGLQGTVMLYSLLTGWRNALVMVVDAVLGCALWSASCIAMLLSIYPPPAAISAEIAAAFASWWVLVRFKCPKGEARGGD